MTKNKTDRKRIKCKEKQKQKRKKQINTGRGERLEWLIAESEWLMNLGNYDKALVSLRKALKITPNDISLLRNLGYLGQRLDRPEIELQALDNLYSQNALEDRYRPIYCNLLMNLNHYEKALDIATETLNQWTEMTIPYKRENKAFLKQICAQAQGIIDSLEIRAKIAEFNKLAKSSAPETVSIPTAHKDGSKKTETIDLTRPHGSSSTDLPSIPLTVEFDHKALESAWTGGEIVTQKQYDLVMSEYNIRLNETFDHLVCLGLLCDVQSFWYQEETVKKVMKRFSGRALLADEVGLGKTIVFMKYLGTLEQLSEFLDWEGIPYAVFHGSMDNAEKDAQIKAFKQLGARLKRSKTSYEKTKQLDESLFGENYEL